MIEAIKATEIRVNDVILFLDKDTGKMRGIDKITKMNLENKKKGAYEYVAYLSHQNTHQGNIFTNTKRWNYFRVTDLTQVLLKYNDEELHSATLQEGDVLEVLVGETGPLISQILFRRVRKDFMGRVKYIDFITKYENLIAEIKFEYSEPYTVKQEVKDNFKKEFLKLIEEICD